MQDRNPVWLYRLKLIQAEQEEDEVRICKLKGFSCNFSLWLYVGTSPACQSNTPTFPIGMRKEGHHLALRHWSHTYTPLHPNSTLFMYCVRALLPVPYRALLHVLSCFLPFDFLPFLMLCWPPSTLKGQLCGPFLMDISVWDCPYSLVNVYSLT